MKIYKPSDVQESTNLYDFIDLLIDNELDLEKKMLNLSSAYEKLILTPFAVNKLIEKLFTKLNFPINFSRKGDNNARYDATISIGNEGYEGIIEVEVPSTAMLDAPRNLLDDIAVVTNRSNMKMEQVIPIVICWTFPNNRTDYWNVVNDINKVLSIKIKTISIMALAVCYWTNNQLKLVDDSFYVDVDNNSLREMIELLSNQNIDLSHFDGFFTPYK
ncbi:MULTISPECIES: hypothetical protein [unclassified Niallia]|uniref:hypothetical protein n=1 Tax=unclassified Niallia TaxID=2837522 RepID=UPI0030FBC92D